ncbi:hypothetical protein OQA88_9942 [Cercophora sp. LCS_1]
MYGANPTYPEDGDIIAEPAQDHPICTPWLYLAGRKQSLEAFTTLIAFGGRSILPEEEESEGTNYPDDHSDAGVTKTGLWHHATAFQNLRGKQNMPFLHLFFEAKLDTPLKEKLPSELILSLTPIIRSQPPLDLIRLMLASAEIFKLLLNHGANIHGTTPKPPFRTPSHIPIYAAISQLVKTGDPCWVQLCISSGANTNHPAPIFAPEVYSDGASWRPLFTSTPLRFYLDSITNWDNPETPRASPLSPSIDSQQPQSIPHPFHLVETPHPLNNFFAKQYTIFNLVKPELHEAVKLLLRHGSVTTSFRLAPLTHGRLRPADSPVEPFATMWTDILTMLAQSPTVNIGFMLADLVFVIGGDFRGRDQMCGRREFRQDPTSIPLCQASLRFLLDVVGCAVGGKGWHGLSGLSLLCRKLNVEARRAGSPFSAFGGPQGLVTPYGVLDLEEEETRERCCLLAYLVRRGADPHGAERDESRDGLEMTPLQILDRGFDGMNEKGRALVGRYKRAMEKDVWTCERPCGWAGEAEGFKGWR